MPTPKDAIFVTSPLEDEHVTRIRAAASDRATVVYEPDLLPPTRYVADHKGVETFSRTPSQEKRWQENLASATILWDFPMSPGGHSTGLGNAPNVRWVQTTSSGVGQLVTKFSLADHPVIITTARGIHAVPLAEFAMMALLFHSKQILKLQRDQQNHQWERYCGSDLPDRVMTIVGAGRVGAEVGRLARAFGMKVISVVNSPSPERRAELHADEVVGSDRIAEAVASADCVVLCVPHTPETENMISAEIIGKLKKGVVFINIARGQIVDETALIEALKTEHIAFAALDVTQVEPLPVTSPLWDLPNVLISPHSASTVESENAKITEIFINNLQLYLSGNASSMMNILDKKKLY